MYTIDSKTQICLRHVVRVETNDRDNSISFQMTNGLCAVKKFGTPEEAGTELTSVTLLIDGA
jgi:hypothetical protein